MSVGKVLVVDDEENIRKILGAMLRAEDYEVTEVSRIGEALRHLRDAEVDVVLTDLKLEREDGLSLLKSVRETGHGAPVIILTAHGTVDSAVDAMKQGAFDYLTKPFDRAELVGVLKKALLTAQYQGKHSVGHGLSASALPMIGHSERMRKIYHLVERVAPADSTVLITGESGTGKELIAQALHDNSGRAKGPFIKINCAAIPATLMESELFGYERGAFTGAVSAKPGRFELADGGTLFLDEIGEMNIEMQVKLLRALQEKTFERVGGLRTIKVDVRLVAATNKELEAAVRDGQFRGDLFYRLNVVPIVLPPLRERPGDVPMLVAYFMKKFSERLKKPNPQVTAETLELLTQFPWPGNIRQLENVLERVTVMSDGGPVMPEHLPEEILEYEEERYASQLRAGGATWRDQVREATRQIERKAIEAALVETANNVTQAARKLHLSRKGLQLKMKELGLR